MRYVYLGDALTLPALRNQRCEPVRRADGKCVVGRRMASQLVRFEGETTPRVVLRRRLRVQPIVPDEFDDDDEDECDFTQDDVIT